ncbi:MAG: ATP phosphoribosyltransferase regulatory subunit [Pseudomonadota bacterium]
MTQPLWMLPQGIEEILPPAAARIEALRRRILDLHARWGYEIVFPPIVEHLESLLTGTGHALDLHTFKLIDPISGRSLGVHADMTPQVARIDASRLQRAGTARLSYVGTVLRTQSPGVGEGRSPLQLGAELFGHNGVESDAEIVSLMLASLELAGIGSPKLDLGHVGVYRALVQAVELDDDDKGTLFDLMLRKSRPELNAFIARLGITGERAEALRALPTLAGDRAVLASARQALSCGGEQVVAALDELECLMDRVAQRHPGLSMLVDLCELRGFSYHTGVVFSAYNASLSREVARGGRYDNVGEYFGRARPATGFSCDLRQLCTAEGHENDDAPSGIIAPNSDEPGLWDAITALRDQGERVVVALSADDHATDLGCDRQLVYSDGDWKAIQV